MTVKGSTMASFITGKIGMYANPRDTGTRTIG
jgi:hypothetical protein